MKRDFNSDLIKALTVKEYTKIEMSMLTVTLIVLFTRFYWIYKIITLVVLRWLFKWIEGKVPLIVIALTAKQMVKGFKEELENEKD